MHTVKTLQQAGSDEKSGFQAVYDHSSFVTSMARTKQYACGGNLSWIKMGFTTSPGVPYNQNSILKLKDFYFQGQEAPPRFPGLIIVAVSLQQAQNGMMSEKGAMESVSPPELVHAFVLRLAELIREKTSDDLLEGWLRVILSTMFMFELLPTVDDRSARADSLRESAVADYHGFAWTVLQKVYHLGLFRQRKERDLGTLSAQRVAQLYNEDSLNWVDVAMECNAIKLMYVSLISDSPAQGAGNGGRFRSDYRELCGSSHDCMVQDVELQRNC